MSNVILKKQEDLPQNLRYLTGKDFHPAEKNDILYVEGFYNVQNIARIPYYIAAALSICLGSLFLYTLISEIIKWNRQSEFRNEGVIITFIMFAFILIFFLICRRFLKKSTLLQKKIASGEEKYGLWITPEYLISRDMNEGLRAVAKNEIEFLDIYRSGRPPIDMAVIHLKNKQVLRVVSDWLKGFNKKPEKLKALIENNLN